MADLVSEFARKVNVQPKRSAADCPVTDGDKYG